MSKNKNSIMMIFSILLLLYAFFLSLYPSILTAVFDKEKFGQQVYKASALVTTVDDVEFRMRPDLTLIITLRNWSSKYIDAQDCFDAAMIEIKTNPLSPITKNFSIKNMYLNHVRFSNQVLPEGPNKLAYLPRTLNLRAFNIRRAVIGAGPVVVNDFRIKNIAPGYYKEDNRVKSEYSKEDVRKFLKNLNINSVKIK